MSGNRRSNTNSIDPRRFSQSFDRAAVPRHLLKPAYAPDDQTHHLVQTQQPRQALSVPVQHARSSDGLTTVQEGKVPMSVQDLCQMVYAMQDDIVDLQQRNQHLNCVVNDQSLKIAKLEADLDSLDQYSRRENVCFTNLLIDETHPCETQIINICHELGVDVTSDDFVATHPLPGKKSRVNKSSGKRYIARFKNRATAQKVFKNRKMTKQIDPEKKKTLFLNKDKGVAVQPNITAKRAALLGQVKDAVEKSSLDSYWVDTKNCNIMLRLNSNDRPIPIMNTSDLLKVVPEFVPREYLLCADPRIFMNNADPFSPNNAEC